MKIWSFTTEFRPTPGGIATYNDRSEEVYRLLPADVTIFFMDPSIESGTHSIEYLPSGIRLVRFRDVEPLSNNEIRSQFGGSNLQQAFAAFGVARDFMRIEGAPDIIELQDYLGIGYFIAAAKYALIEPFTKVSISVICHNPSFNVISNNRHNSTKYFTGEMERFCYAAADLVRFPSAHMQLKLSSSINIKRSAIVPHPISGARFTKSCFSRGRPNQLAFVGRLNLHKRPHALVELANKFWADQPEAFQLAIFGRDAPHPHLHTTVGMFLRSRYREHVDAGRLSFEGEYDRDDLRERLRDVGLVVLPYEEEAFSYVLIEALESGKLPLITEGGGQIELLPPALRDKYSFDINSLPDFSKKIHVLMTEDSVTLENDWSDICQYVIKKCNSIEISDTITTCYGSLLRVDRRTSYPFIRGSAVESLDSEKKLLMQLRESTQGAKGTLSVVVPFYNMGAFVNATVTSILRSSYRPIEIILVDDGSSDETSVDVAQRLAETYPTIVNYLRVPNGGLARARNVGAKAAKGEFIAFLDPDDTVNEDYYEKAVRVLNAYDNVDFVGCWVCQFDEGDDYWITFTPEFPFHLYHNTINSSSIVARRDVFLKHGLNDPDFIYGMEDYEATIRMMANGARGVVIPEPLFLHRMRTGSMSNLFSQSSTDWLYALLRTKHQAIFGRFWTDLEGLAANSGHGALVANPAFPMQSISHEIKTRERLINVIEQNFSQGEYNRVLALGKEFLNVYRDSYQCWMMTGKAAQHLGDYAAAIHAFKNAQASARNLSSDTFWSFFHLVESLACGAFVNELELELEKTQYRDKKYYDLMKGLHNDIDGSTNGVLRNRQLPCIPDASVLSVIARFLWKVTNSPEDGAIFGDYALRAGNYSEEVGDALATGATLGKFWPLYHRLHFLAVTGRYQTMRRMRTQLMNARVEINGFLGALKWLVTELWQREHARAAVDLWRFLADSFRNSQQTRENGDAETWLNFGTDFVAKRFQEGEKEKENREQLARIAEHICRISPRNAVVHFFFARYLELDKGDFAGAATIMEISYAEDQTNFWAGLHLVRALRETGDNMRASNLTLRLMVEHPSEHHHVYWFLGRDSLENLIA